MIFNEEHKSVLINNVLKSNITKYKIKSDYISINNQNTLNPYCQYYVGSNQVGVLITSSSHPFVINK